MRVSPVAGGCRHAARESRRPNHGQASVGTSCGVLGNAVRPGARAGSEVQGPAHRRRWGRDDPQWQEVRGAGRRERRAPLRS